MFWAGGLEGNEFVTPVLAKGAPGFMNKSANPKNGACPLNWRLSSPLRMSKKTPKPPRTLVLPSLNGSHAKPNRGAQSFLSGKLAPVGAPASPGKSRPFGAFGNLVDCCPNFSENDRPRVSSLGELY